MGFKEAMNGIVLKSSDLALPLSTSSRLGRYAYDYVQAMNTGASRNTAAQVRKLILATLAAGNSSLSSVARQLGMDVRTVRRHLNHEGSSFNALLREVRHELAPRYLTGPVRSRSELALLLGFSAPQSFARWFHHEFGVPVAEWIETQNSPISRASPKSAQRTQEEPSN